MDHAGIDNACVKEYDRTLFSVAEDVKILFHLIKMTENETALLLIIRLNKESEKLEGIMESGGDFDTLRSIFEIIKATGGQKYLNMEFSKNADTVMNIGEIIDNTKDLKFNKTDRTFSQFELDTALISSCRRGYIFLVSELVHLGADKETRDKNGNTPLLICVENHFTSTAKLLIRQKVNINTENDFGNTALILATRSTGSIEMVKLLLAQKRINVNHQNREGNTALMKAINARNFNVMKLILNSKESTIDVLQGMKNWKGKKAQDIADKLGIGNTVKLLLKQNTEVHNPILAAFLMCDTDSFDILMDCQVCEQSDMNKFIRDSFRDIFMEHYESGEKFNKNEEKIIQRLLQYGAAVNDCFYSSNPFVVATQVGSINVLKMLLNDKANLHRLYSLRLKNLLAVSAEHGHADILELLLKHDHDMSAKSFTMPALITAMKNGHLRCVELLKKHGASLDFTFAFASFVKDNDSVRLKYLVDNFKAGIRREVSAEVMDNFLVAAARTGDIDIIGLLIDAGANVNCVNGAKKTPLMEAKNVKVVNFLVQRGAFVNNNSTEHDQVYTPLAYVLSKDYYQYETTDKVKIVEALLKNGASVNGDIGSNSPLMIAIMNKADKNIVQLLLDYGADVTVRDGEGNTVLLNAAENGSTEIIECLLQQSKIRNIINVQNHDSLTALMVSVLDFDHLLIKALIDLGADVNIKDEDGNTSLMIALSMHIRRPKVLTTLIQAGSDLNSQNNNGRSPLMLAAYATWENALIILVDSGADVNAVGENNETALSLAMQIFNTRQLCSEYLLDNGARASYVTPDFLFRLILNRDMKLIPKLLHGGFGPTEVCSRYLGPASITPVSPLCLALMTGNVKLASYFVQNLFVTQSDMFTLIHHKDVRRHLHKHKLYECLGVLDKLAAQPLSLFSLAFIAVQSAVGSAPRREERVSTLPLPGKFKDRLMFKTEIQPLDLSSTIDEVAVHHKIILDKGKRRLVIVNNYILNAVHYESSSEESSDESSSEESSNEASSEESSNEASSDDSVDSDY